MDRPYVVQYLEWIWNIVGYGNFGTSFWTGEPVLSEMVRRLPLTVELAIGTVLISLLIALPTGIISAVRQDSLLDYTGRFLSIAAYPCRILDRHVIYYFWRYLVRLSTAARLYLATGKPLDQFPTDHPSVSCHGHQRFRALDARD